MLPVSVSVTNALKEAQKNNYYKDLFLELSKEEKEAICRLVGMQEWVIFNEILEKNIKHLSDDETKGFTSFWNKFIPFIGYHTIDESTTKTN